MTAEVGKVIRQINALDVSIILVEQNAMLGSHSPSTATFSDGSARDAGQGQDLLVTKE